MLGTFALKRFCSYAYFSSYSLNFNKSKNCLYLFLLLNQNQGKKIIKNGKLFLILKGEKKTSTKEKGSRGRQKKRKEKKKYPLFGVNDVFFYN